MKKTKSMRVLSFLLAMLLMTSLFPAANVTAFADSDNDTVVIWNSEDLANIRVAGSSYAQFVNNSVTSQTYNGITVEAGSEWTCFASEYGDDFRWSNNVRFTSSQFIKAIEVTDSRGAHGGMIDNSWSVSGSTFTSTISNPGKTVTLNGEFNEITQIKFTLTDVVLNPISQSFAKDTSCSVEAALAEDTDIDATWSVDGGIAELYLDEECTDPLSANTATSQKKIYVKGIEEGAGVVTVNYGEAGSASCALTVTPPVTGVTLNCSQFDLIAGNANRVQATVATSGATDTSVSWSSSNNAVASVDGSGLVTAISEGTATITATSNADKTKSAECRVIVEAHVPKSADISIGEFYMIGDTITNTSSELIYFVGDSPYTTAVKFPANESLPIVGKNYEGYYKRWYVDYSKTLYEVGSDYYRSQYLEVAATYENGFYGVVVKGGSGTESDPFVFTMAEPPFTHNYVYTQDGATLTMTCADEDCPVVNMQATLTLKADDKVYDGNPVEARLEKSSLWKNPDGQAPSEITYDPSNSAQPGTYTAGVTVGDYALTKQFTISGSKWRVMSVDLNKSGVYKLNEDITAEDGDTTITINKDSVVDLNGHTIDANGGNFDIFKVTGGTFTLTDSSASKSGTVTGSKASGVTVNGGSFVINSGNVTGNAYGVKFLNGSVTLSGAPTIDDNFGEETKDGQTYPIERNLYIADGKTVNIGQMDSNALVGISAENDAQASGENGIAVGNGSNLEDYEDCFFADRSSVNDDTVVIVLPGSSGNNDMLYVGGTDFHTIFPVSFYSAGSLYGEVQNVPLNGTINRPADPTRAGYTFVRWELYGHDDDGNTLAGQDFDFNTPVTKPMVFEAIWKQNQYKVTFINGSTSTSINVLYGASVANPGKPSAPSATENTFAGWVMAETVSTRDVNGQSILMSKDTAYDFNSPVYTDIKLKSTWTHVHNHKLYTLNDLFGADNDTAKKYNGSLHVRLCDCGDYAIEAHTFVNGKCECGYVKPTPPVVKVTIHYTNCLEGGSQTSMEMQETVVKGTEVYYATSEFYKKTNIFDHWEIANHGQNNWETVSTQRVISFKIYQTIDLRAVYKPYNAEPMISLRTGQAANKDYTLAFISKWWVPSNWQILSIGMKIGDNDRLRYWSNASMGRIAVNDYPLMNYKKKVLGVSLGTWGGGYRPVTLMRNMMQGVGFSANRNGQTFAANVDSRTLRTLVYSGQQSETLNVGKKHKGDWQYVFAYVEVRDPLNNHFIYYTDPVQMRYSEWEECNRVVGTIIDPNTGKQTQKCSIDMYCN